MEMDSAEGCFNDGWLGEVCDETWELLLEDGDFKGCALAATSRDGKPVYMSTRQCSLSNLWNTMPALDQRVRSLIVLDLHKCRYIKYLHESVCDLVDLKKLILTRCSNLRSLPSNIGNLRNLTEVCIAEEECLFSMKLIN